MKLIDIVPYLLSPSSLEILYEKFPLDKNSECILIYAKESLRLNAEIVLFPIEETEDNIHYQKDENNYIQLFPVDYAIDLIELDLDLKNKGFSNEYIAQRLLTYRLNDA